MAFRDESQLPRSREQQRGCVVAAERVDCCDGNKHELHVQFSHERRSPILPRGSRRASESHRRHVPRDGDATDERISLFPEWETEIRAYYGRWEEMLGGSIQPTVDLFKALKDKGLHQIVALTNWSHESFPVAQERYDFLDWFDGIVVSGVEKTRKPYLPIYEILLARYNVEPTSAVFIDDSLPNVEAARSLGIHGIHFQSAAQLQADLMGLGVVS